MICDWLPVAAGQEAVHQRLLGVNPAGQLQPIHFSTNIYRIMTDDSPMTHPPTAIINSATARKVARSIARHGMLAAGDRVLTAVSGGADSTALLHILHAMRPHLGITLAVAHLNHGLRDRAADDDARFVENLAGRLEMTFHGDCIRLDPSQGSIEERGRRARYAFFDRLAQKYGYSKIALGHHMDDNAEAVLLHLLRGSGLRGLSGIPPVRGQRIVRPLIDLRRAEIIAFLREHRISFVQDASNTDLRFDRNKVRQTLIPFLQRHFNPNVTAVLHRTADLCRQEEHWLQALLAPSLNKAVESLDPECMVLRIQKLSTEPLAAQRRLLRDGLHRWRGSLKRVGADHIDALIDLLAPQSEGKRLCLPNRIGAERIGSRLRFTIRSGRGCPPSPQAPDYLYEIPFPEERPCAIAVLESGLVFHFSLVTGQGDPCPDDSDGSAVWFDADQLTFPLHIRNFRPGDRMRPLGLQGHRKIKKVFNDRKIPAARRHGTPLLVSGNEILWVVGVRRSELAIPAGTTTRMLRVRTASDQGSAVLHKTGFPTG
jgi:tRNA(Ile)-lysidine synthase